MVASREPFSAESVTKQSSTECISFFYVASLLRHAHHTRVCNSHRRHVRKPSLYAADLMHTTKARGPSRHLPCTIRGDRRTAGHPQCTPPATTRFLTTTYERRNNTYGSHLRSTPRRHHRHSSDLWCTLRTLTRRSRCLTPCTHGPNQYLSQSVISPSSRDRRNPY